MARDTGMTCNQITEKFNVNAPMERVDIKSVGDIAKEIDRLIAEQHGDKKSVGTPA